MQPFDIILNWILEYWPEAVGGLLGGVCLGLLFSLHLSVKTYHIQDAKITKPLRIVLLCDLHSSRFGKGNKHLLRKIERQNPDFVLFGGDTIDDHRPTPPAYELLRILGERYPCYLVTGNHEYRTLHLDDIRKNVTSCGVNVLQNTSQHIATGVNLVGLEDPEGLLEMFSAELARLGNSLNPDDFNILLTHRPEHIDAYRAYPYDLVMCGHAHGGQWRIPGILKGFYSPGQGFFPAYTDDMYKLGRTRMVVSRGLSKKNVWLLRMCNRPQVVSIVLENGLPEGKGN